MKVYKKILLAVLACGVFAPQTGAQRFAVKAYGDIGLTKGISLSTALPGSNTKASTNAFGVDFGYKFWNLKEHSLEANIGLSYRMASAKFNTGPLSYSYSAPASADDDGNPYIRYTDLSAMSQKSTLGYIEIPIYLQYQYRINKWLGVHADFGFGLAFRCAESTGQTSGTATSYGVYPEYDDLVIKEGYLNAFGERSLSDAHTAKANMKGFAASIICGVGFEFYAYGPLSFNLGIRYNAGLTDVFGGGNKLVAGATTAENAPVTYTVANGQQVKSLSDYVTKSRLNPLSLNIGVNIRFP